MGVCFFLFNLEEIKNKKRTKQELQIVMRTNTREWSQYVGNYQGVYDVYACG